MTYNWFNLKKNKCPKCGKDWAFDVKIEGNLMRHGCEFVISQKKYRKIVTGMVVSDLDETKNGN